MRILILGGYGTFGGRLAFLLADEPALTLLIAGRSLIKAEAFCNTLSGASLKQAVRFDRDADVEAQLRVITPDVVVDASGPFQMYGDDPYLVIKACIALGLHYLDLADGSEFVAGVAQFDAAAKARDVFVLSGVSSFPVLTAAVVRALSADMTEVTRITGGIAPSPYAGVGLNVIRAIASYAGQPVTLIRHGRHAVAYALTETMRYTIAPPGRLPLRPVRFSLVDVPDLRVIPQLWPRLDAVWMGAGPVPEILHRALNGLAWLVRLRLLPSLSALSRLFYRAINVLVWGEHRGGMFVAVDGVDVAGQQLTRSWHLLAEGDDGPLIPSMAIEAIVRHLLAGRSPAAGARSAVRELELSDYQQLFARRCLYTGFRSDAPLTPRASLYERLLGDAWQSLPAPIREMHNLHATKTVVGKADVERGQGLVAGLVARLFGFPAAGKGVPIAVTYTVVDGKEHWQRNFNGKQFSSVQSEGRGESQWLLVERFGVFTFGLALVVENSRLQLVVRRWSLLGLRLPLSWAPRGEAYESAQGNRFNFHVEIAHPLLGLLVRYQGVLSAQHHDQL
jgi:Domain of unknown function (DUF4166)/Saccharopine dehydrogenase NADP binding domain